jgi:enoyl-CoA hydratase
MGETVQTRDTGSVRIITMSRPAVHNAMNLAMATTLHATLHAAAQDAQVKAVVLTGSGGSFSSGLDIKEMAGDDGALLRFVTEPSTNPFRALRDLPQPTLAAVDGPAITGGLELVLNCDLVLASERGTFADTHAKVGIMPAQGLAALLSAAIGVPAAKWMSYTGRPIEASEAQRLGLVAQVLPSSRLVSEAEEVARTLASLEPPVARAMKRLYDEGLQGTRAEWERLEHRLFDARLAALQENGNGA